MYPRISDLFQDLFGFDFPIPIYSFGFMVAVAILTAAWLLSVEFKRMHEIGRIGPVTMPATGKNAKGRRKGTRKAPPTEVVGTIAMLAAVSGIVGAKIFHIFENFGEFLRDPAAMVFSAGGLTFYGGLIVATLIVGWYVRKKGIPVLHFFDAVAPGLMIAYGIGRIGCHVAGDGDWGIAADMTLKPDWLPTWLWAETYPNNILGVTIAEPGVYPTPIYEFAACLILFGVLWSLRRHPFKAGWLFSLYLLLNGLERFLIEQIRVNVRMDFFGMDVTQAEIISSLLMVVGIVGLLLAAREKPRLNDPPADEDSVTSRTPAHA